MNKRLLTMDDLYSYYSSMANSSHFSSKEANSPIVVQVNGRLNFEEDSNLQGLQRVVLQACHIGENINKSNIDQAVMEKALPSFKNRPILGYIHEVDGQYEFYGHNMHMDDDENIVYDEIPIGIIPESCDAHLEYDEEKDKTYCIVNGYIFEEYTKATEILQREKECSVSVELSIREMSYNAVNKLLNIEDFYFSGVTILGKDDQGNEVKPGMAGANIQLADFSIENNSMFSNAEVNTKLIDTLEKLNSTLESFNIKNTIFEKGGKEGMTKLEELLEKYGKTEEDLDFETEGLSDEELEAKFAEVFGEAEGDPTSEDGGEDDFSTCKPKKKKKCSEEEGSEEDEESDDEFATCKPKKKKKCSKEVRELENGNMEIAFEVSHDDIKNALYNLISQFEELDNECYMITAVYDDHFIMESWSGGNIYGCDYSVDEDNVSLVGERYKLYREFLTESEKSELDSMRSNYSAIEEKLHKYEKAELDAQKAEVFEDVSYSEYLETEEFKSLIADKDKYSVDELKDKAEIAFAKCVKKNGKFAVKEDSDLPVKTNRHVFSKASSKDKKSKPYGNIFGKN